MDFADEPSPPTQEEMELHAAVFDVCKYLDQARGDDVPDPMVYAFNIVRGQASRRKGLRPSIEQRDQMLNAASGARFSARKFLEQAGRDERAGDWGLDALMGLVHFWAETDKERAARHPDTLYDLLDHAGMGRNEFRSAQMFQSIEERAQRRHADMVTKLCPMFGEHEQGAA